MTNVITVLPIWTATLSNVKGIGSFNLIKVPNFELLSVITN